MSRRDVIVMAVVAWLLMAGAISVTRAADTQSPPSHETAPSGEPDLPHLSQEIRAELRKQCEPDAKRLCRFVIPGGGRIYRCLEAHTSDLSAGCRKALSELVPKP